MYDTYLLTYVNLSLIIAFMSVAHDVTFIVICAFRRDHNAATLYSSAAFCHYLSYFNYNNVQ